jgi:hypothetical protein
MSSSYRLAASIGIASLLSACAQMAWQKPGTTKEDFTQARYACMREAQQHVGATASASAHVVMNQSLFDACMASHGWTWQRQPSAEEQAALNEAMDRLTPEYDALCTRPDLQVHFRKTPCNPEDATLEQLADSSRINEPEKIALAKIRTAQESINKQWEEAIAKTSPKLAPDLIGARAATLSKSEKVLLDFYQGHITRGEYNRARKELSPRTRNWSSR